MGPSKIVILGGGVGGTIVANLLARKLSPRQVQITLIDRTGRHSYQPGWLYLPFQERAPERLVRDERRLLNRRVTLVVGEAAHINQQACQIEMRDTTIYPYDILVIATGAQLAPEALDGYSDGAYHFYSAEAAVRLREALRRFSGGRILVGVADIPYKCPPAPLEFTFLLDEKLRRRGLREQTEIVYLSPINRVFPIASVSELVTPLLEQRDIRYELFFNPESINAQARQITSLEGTTFNYDLLVLVPPHRGSQLVIASGLGDAQGWIATDRETLISKADARIFVLGDATDLPVSKSGSAAHFEAKVVAKRIISRIQGQPEQACYSGEVMCFLETGQSQATQLVFDYTHPPQPPQPSRLYHYEKSMFNHAYWYLVPPGLV